MPQSYSKKLFPEQGGAMLLALMIFLIISMLATAVIGVAAMESKVAVFDTRREQARQAADAGIQVARNVAMNYMGGNASIPTALPELDLGNGEFAQVSIDNGELNSKGIVKITSRGRVVKNGQELARRTAKASVYLNVLPNAAVQTEEFKILGKYYTEFQLNPITYSGGVLGLLPLNGPSNPKCSDLSGMTPDNPGHYFWFVDYKYYPTSGLVNWSRTYGHTIPYWQAQGKVNIRDINGNPAKVAINHWGEAPESELTPDELDDLYYKVDMEDQMLQTVNDLLHVKYHKPPRYLNSYDFIGAFDEVAPISKYPVFGPGELERYRQLAQEAAADPNGKWAYLPADATVINNDSGKHILILDEIINPANPNYIGKPYIFADLNPDDTLLLDFRTYKSSNITIPDGPFIKWSDLEPFFNDINNRLQTFLHLFSNDLNGITIVTPASIEAGYDSMVFKPAAPGGKETAIALFSGKNISFQVDPKLFNTVLRVFPDLDPDTSSRQIRTYLLAGDSVNISSTVRELTVKGVISSTKKVTVKLDYYDLAKVTTMDKFLNIINDPSIISEFPDPWAYMGLGPIISYKYSDE